MDRFPGGFPGVDAFWEQADLDGSTEHPLERELVLRLDAMARYRRLIADAQADARDHAAEILLRQQMREAQRVRRVLDALDAMRRDRAA